MRSLRVHSQRHPRGPINGRGHPSFLRWALRALASISGLAVSEGPRWALRLPLIVATPLLALALWWQLSQRDGWRTGARPVDGSAFVAGIVRALTPEDAGAIYL